MSVIEMVDITRSYQMAGEELRVLKEVALDYIETAQKRIP